MWSCAVKGKAQYWSWYRLIQLEEITAPSQASPIYGKNSIDGKATTDTITNPDRPFNKDLDGLPFPARQLLPNQSYIQFGKKQYGYSITTVMSTRGCPYDCEFCSNVIFGGSYRERSAKNVVDEIEQALSIGYDRISFADDVFTMRQKRVLEVCEEIKQRSLQFNWECLARVDSIDAATYVEMYRAGCRRVYFGIESGDDTVLKLMNKKITADQARHAVMAAHQAGLEVGAFFILFYPGETNQTVLEHAAFRHLPALGLPRADHALPAAGHEIIRKGEGADQA